MESHTRSWFAFFPIIGGLFVFLVVLVNLIFYFGMNFLTYMHVIMGLFKVDPAKGQTPRDPHSIERSTPANLLTMAQRRLKERKPLNGNPILNALLNVEAAIMRVFTCKDNSWALILNQGRSQIRRELNLFNFLKQQREIAQTFEAVAPFETRRIIKKQVKAGLLVAPYNRMMQKLYGGRLWGSEEEPDSSEEDLDYLRWELQEKKTLTPDTMKLLRGVV
jgi:hypothetical protein